MTAPAPLTECGICGVPHPARPCGLLERHIERLRLAGQAETSIYQRRRVVTRTAKALPVCLADATAADLYTWRAGLRLGADSVNHEVGHLRSFYRWLIAEGLREDNPAETLPVPKVPRRLPRPIGGEDLMLVLDHVPLRVRVWIILAAWAGLRACEIAYLRVENVCLDDPPRLVLTATKGNVQRVVPLCDFALSELKAVMPRTGYVFRRRDGQRGPNKPFIISQLASKALHDAGVNATLHQCRHWFGTETWRASHDLRTVQEMLGHADVRSTVLYTLHDSEAAQAAVAKLPVPRLRLVT